MGNLKIPSQVYSHEEEQLAPHASPGPPGVATVLMKHRPEQSPRCVRRQPGAPCASSHFIVTLSWAPHFANKETKAQRSLVTCPGPSPDRMQTPVCLVLNLVFLRTSPFSKRFQPNATAPVGVTLGSRPPRVEVPPQQYKLLGERTGSCQLQRSQGHCRSREASS